MNRPEEHEIDTAAQRLFESALPSSWVARKQEPDYGIDYIVDVFTEGAATGVQFAAQLKGSRSVKRKNGVVTFPLETKHLVYYVDKVRQPVFLIRIDVTEGSVYWIFLQQYAMEALAGARWRQQKSVTVRIPTMNVVADVTAFQKAIFAAEKYMLGMHPASLSTAIGNAKKKWESKDPRFNVQVRTDGGAISFEFHAKEVVPAKFLFQSKDEGLAHKLHDLIGRGMPVSFAAGEISVEGLPALQEVLADGITIQWARRIPASVRMARIGPDGAIAGDLDISGHFSGGMRETRFEGRLGESPLFVSFTLKSEGPHVVSTINMAFDIARWTQHPLLHLPYFDQIQSVFGGDGGLHFDIRCFVQGNRLFVANHEPKADGATSGIAKIVRSLQRGRQVDTALRLGTVLPADLTDEDLRDAEVLHDVVIRGEYRRPASGDRLSVKLDRPKRNNIRKSMTGSDAPTTGSVSFHGGPHSFSFFRTLVPIEHIEISLTHARPSVNNESFAAELSRRQGSVTVAWEGTEASELIIRKIDGESP